MRRKHMIVIMSLAGVLLLFSSCAMNETTKTSQMEESSPTDEPLNLLIDEINLGLLTETANQIATEVRDAFQKGYDGRYRIDNEQFDFTLLNKGDKVWYVVKMTSVWTMIRQPEDDPMIQGMYEAKEQFKTSKERKEAQAIIDGFVAELGYMGSEVTTNYVSVKCRTTGYELYYGDIRNNEQLTPLKDAFPKEDIEKRKQGGRDAIKQYMPSE